MNKQNPFSIYDFLGYLIPGSLFLYTVFVIDYLKKTPHFDINNLVKSFSEIHFENIFIFIILSYSLGHLLSFTSSITIEKYANWKYSYPSKYLLNIPYVGYWKSTNSIRGKFWRLILIGLLFPVVALDLILGELFGFKQFYRNGLDFFLQKVIIFKLEKLLKKLGIDKVEGYEESKAGDSDFHRIVTHYTFENSKQHQSRMSNYVALYGFLRNLSLIFNLIAWYYFYRISFYLTFNVKTIFILGVIIIISYLSFMAFMKFYRRYTLEGFMLIAVDEDLK